MAVDPSTSSSERATMGASGGPGNASWMLLVLFTVPLIGYVHRLIINILIDPISQELAITDTQASFLQGPPFAVAYALMVVPWACLPTVVIGCCCWEPERLFGASVRLPVVLHPTMAGSSWPGLLLVRARRR